MSIVVVRHGETDWNRELRIQGSTDIPLNDTGRAQARATGTALSEWPALTRVVTSPLSRAEVTGRIIAEELGIEYAGHDPALMERNYGEAEGLKPTEISAKWPGKKIPGAEPPEVVAARGAAALDRIAQEAPGTVVVSHGAYIRAALKQLTGNDIPRIANGEAWHLERDADGQYRCERICQPAGAR